METVALNFVDPPASGHGGKLVSLQYVRAIGVTLVVLWHTGWTRSVLGQSGVDLFFVVSGFVMMLVSGRERSPLQFALARVTRIVPLYWAVTLLVAYLDQAPAGKLVASLLFWPASLYPIIIPGWSLNLEMAYYGLFALALFGPLRWRVPVLAVEMVVCFVILPVLFPASVPLRLWSNPMWFEFLAGAALYTAWVRGAVPTGRPAWLLIGGGAAVLAATHFLGGAPEGWGRVLAWGAPALAIVMGALGVERSGQLPQIALLETLGAASYSIYLTHYAALGYVSPTLRPLWAPVAATIVLLLSYAIGWAVHRGFELPLHRWSRRLIKRRRKETRVPPSADIGPQGAIDQR